jgi:DNA-binding transcriptional regulator YdaS (Cro superfamily)
MKQTLYTATLARAAELVGGPEKLAEALGVPQSMLASWMTGDAQVPMGEFLRVVELTRKAEREH